MYRTSSSLSLLSTRTMHSPVSPSLISRSWKFAKSLSSDILGDAWSSAQDMALTSLDFTCKEDTSVKIIYKTNRAFSTHICNEKLKKYTYPFMLHTYMKKIVFTNSNNNNNSKSCWWADLVIHLHSKMYSHCKVALCRYCFQGTYWSVVHLKATTMYISNYFTC